MSKIVEVQNLYKRYSNGTEAVKNVNFNVRKGEIFGLIGPNGAGKSTTLKIIATLLKPTSGKIMVNNIDVVQNPLEARKQFTYLPESVSAPPRDKVIDLVKYFAELYSVNTGKSVDKMVERALTISRLDEYANKKVSELSKGMLRRLMIGITLMPKPQLIILDEPTSGVDVIESIRIKKILRDVANSGTAIIFSSHNMLEVETLCDRVALMYNGKILKIGSVDEVRGDNHNLEDAFMKMVGDENE